MKTHLLKKDYAAVFGTWTGYCGREFQSAQAPVKIQEATCKRCLTLFEQERRAYAVNAAQQASSAASRLKELG